MRPRTMGPILVGLLALGIGLPLARTSPALAVSPDIVVSQVYGGGGNSGAPYSNKFVELFNRGASTAGIGGWSIQYASATGTGNFSANVVAMPEAGIPAGGYFLVQLAGGTNGAPLPTPDATGSINPAATAGKIILAATSAGLACNGGSNPCSASQLALIVDLVGYGGANFYEGAGPAPALSATAAALRLDAGCTDTDDNAADFAVGAPAPRNSASALNLCPGSQPSPTPTFEPTLEPTPSSTPALTPSPIPTRSPTQEPTISPSPTSSATLAPPPTPSPTTFAFTGFGSPVANLPAVNVVKAGAAVPLSFSLGGDFGLDVIGAGSPSSRSHSCDSADSSAPLDTSATPGDSGLSYDAVTDTYTYVWKTNRAWAGSCRTLVLQLADGNTNYAEFAFR